MSADNNNNKKKHNKNNYMFNNIMQLDYVQNEHDQFWKVKINATFVAKLPYSYQSQFCAFISFLFCITDKLSLGQLGQFHAKVWEAVFSF